MNNQQAGKDDNAVSTLLGINNSDDTSTVKIWADPNTHRLLVDGIGATGPTGPTGHTGATGPSAVTVADGVYTPIVSITIAGGLITAIATA